MTLEPVMSWKPKALLSLFSDFSEKSETQKQSVVISPSKMEHSSLSAVLQMLSNAPVCICVRAP